MTCEAALKAIPLYLYGELSAEMEENVEAHCATCAACNNEVHKQRSLSSTLTDHELEPSLDLLVECRQLLADRIRAHETPLRQPTWFERLMNLTIAFRVPVAATALVALGYFGAQLYPALQQSNPNLSPASLISTVRAIQPDSSGRVRISIDDVQRHEISGAIDDQRIRQLLLASLREESNPGVRVESVDVLKDLAAAEDVRAALLDAVQHDPNAGVRIKALEGLKQFAANPEVRKTLTSVLLKDANPGVRIQVIDLLSSRKDENMVGVLENLFGKEDNHYVRMRLQRALQEMNASPGTF